MENQDKLFEQFKDAAQKTETRDFPAMEKVWARVEEKLDKKEDRKVIAIWKKLAVAASLLLFLALGYHYLNTGKERDVPMNHENNVVITTTKDATTSPVVPIVNDEKRTLQKDAEEILENQRNPQHVATSDDEKSNSKIKRSNRRFYVVNAESDLTITGIVSDESGFLPGANVFIKGTNKVTQTDYDGKFSIKAKKGDSLLFSFVGMEQAIAIIEDQTKIDMKLNEGVALNEVVVQGYMVTKEKKSVGYSTSTVKSESVGDKRGRKAKDKYRDGDKETAVAVPNQAVLTSLQGQVAGLNITGKNQAGARTTVILRGISSVQPNSPPLYIVDGIPVQSEIFSTLPPDDIKSINVVKGNAATALYGNRAANGAIIVETKTSMTKKEIRKKLRKLKKAKTANQTSRQDPAPQSVEVSQEDYDSFIENPFESPKTAPLSTFSIDVDNASYTNIRRFINNGQTVPKDAVRVEEMVNFFKYQYPQPKDSNPFSINTEYSQCPWNPNHQLLKIGLQGKNIPTDNLPASNLVFLIDVSGSMSDDNKLPLLKQSMKILVNELRKEDKVTIVVYAGAAGMVLPPTSGNEKQTIIDALEKLNAGGSTAGGEGIELAYKMAQENFIKGGNNRVILATDGDFNIGASSNTDMETLIEEKRKSGVFLTCLGYGMGNYKDSKMEILADKGNGNYAYIDNIQEANRFLGKEFKGSMFAIAKDVKIQIEFNPKHVQSYRLIGYENRKLRPEDFTNDAIDAGELGSGHTVTALYEIIPTGVKSDYFNETPELKYTKTQPNGNNSNDELATIKFRYKKPDGDKSIEMVKVIENKQVPLRDASDDFKFSASVAWFGLKLRDSKLVGNKSSEDIKKLAKEGLSHDDEGYKAEFVRLVEAVK